MEASSLTTKARRSRSAMPPEPILPYPSSLPEKPRLITTPFSSISTPPQSTPLMENNSTLRFTSSTPLPIKLVAPINTPFSASSLTLKKAEVNTIPSLPPSPLLSTAIQMAMPRSQRLAFKISLSKSSQARSSGAMTAPSLLLPARRGSTGLSPRKCSP